MCIETLTRYANRFNSARDTLATTK